MLDLNREVADSSVFLIYLVSILQNKQSRSILDNFHCVNLLTHMHMRMVKPSKGHECICPHIDFEVLFPLKAVDTDYKLVERNRGEI